MSTTRSTFVEQALARLLFVVAPFAIATGTLMYYVASGSRSTAIVVVGLAFALIAGAISFAVWRARVAVHLSFDEGGVRVLTTRQYFPFAAMREGLIDGGLRIVHEGGVYAARLREGQSPDLHAQLVAGIERARAAAQSSGADATLRRGAQAIDAWLARAREEVGGRYRQQGIDTEELFRIAEDPNGRVDVRAAAAHVLVRTGDDTQRARVIEGLHKTTPPLVVVAAALGTSRGTYVAQLEEAMSYLDPEDRPLAARMLEERAPRS